MIGVLKSILNLGINKNHTSLEIRRIKTVNLLNSITLLFLLIGVSNYFFLKQDYPLTPELVFIFLALVSMLCSYFGQTEISFLVFTFNANLSLLFIVLYYPFQSGSYLFYFPLIVSVILLNNVTSRNWMAYVHFLISGIGFLLAIFLNVPHLRLQGLPESTVNVLWYYNMIMSALITATVSGLLNRLIYLQNREIEAQNLSLRQAKEDINNSLKEKEVLLAEVNHRVKNNLALISGLLNLQLEGSIQQETRQMISESKNRIMSMALVHQMLYNHPQLEEINLGHYSRELIRELLNTSNLSLKVKVNEYYASISLPVNKSIPFGLILNEIITNSIKYAFIQGNPLNSSLEINIKDDNKIVHMVIRDSGSGFPRDMNMASEDNSLGIFLIKTLAEQIDGTVHFSNENGAKVELRFPMYS